MFQAVPQIRRPRVGLQILRTGATEFVVLNPAGQATITIGAEERYLLHLLQTVDAEPDILQQFAARFQKPLSSRRLHEFLEQLANNELLSGTESTSGGTRPATPVSRSADRPGSDGRTVNAVFDVLVLCLGWLVHPLVLIPVAILSTVATVTLVQKWSEFLLTLGQVWVTVPLLPLLATLFLKSLFLVSLPRELIVGLCCRRHKGHIRSFGIVFHRGSIPAFHCDIGDALAWMSSTGSWTVMLSGMVANLTLASLAIIGWGMSPSGGSLAPFLAVLVPVNLIALLMHLNPLFPGDMCRALCYWQQDARLRERALAEFQAWLCGRRSPEPLGDRERFWLRLYGLGIRAGEALAYVVIVGLGGWWLVYRFHLTGALVLIAALAIWFWQTLRSWMMWVLLFGGPWWIRWPVRLLLIAGLVALGFVPYPHEIVGECRLVPAGQLAVRAQIDDEIVSIHVTDGDVVQAGDLIATLSGRDTRHELEVARAELARFQADLDLLRAGSRPEDIKIAESRVEACRARLQFCDRDYERLKELAKHDASSIFDLEVAERDRLVAVQELLAANESLAIARLGPRYEEIRAAEAQVQKTKENIAYLETRLTMLELRAPIAGKIIAPGLHQRTGQWVNVGELLCIVQDQESLQVEIAADPAAVAHVADGLAVNVRLYGTYGELITGHVDRVATAAEEGREYRLHSLRSDRETLLERSSNHADADVSHVRVYARLDYTERPLQPGMRGYARIVVGPDVVWRAFWRPVQRFVLTEVWSWLP